MKATIRGRGLGALTLIVLVAATATARIPSRPIVNRTLQNLAGGRDGFFGWHLKGDETTGSIELSRLSGEEESGTYWEIHGASQQREYLAHTIRNRGNSVYNGSYLAINGRTGEIILRENDGESAKWLIRYAGKYSGYDAYYIQNLAKTIGGYDMQFLAIDETTGRVTLSRKPVPGAHWCFGKTRDLPREGID